MHDFFKFPAWLRRLQESPKSELTRWQRAARFSIDLAIHCAGELRHDKATQMAAALTYHTLFSLMPMVVLALVAVNAFVGPEEREAFKRTVVDWAVGVLQDTDPAVLSVIGPPTVGVDLEEEPAEEPLPDEPIPEEPEAEEPAAPDAPARPIDPDAPAEPEDPEPTVVQVDPEDPYRTAEAAEEVEPPARAVRREEFEQVRQRLDEELTNLLAMLEQVDIRGIGIGGLLIFIYGATALLATIEASFNAVYGTPEGRPWYIRLPLYYTLITLGPVVLVGAQILQTQLFATLEVRDWTSWLVGPVGVLAPLLATWLILFLLYVLMPNATVGKRAAAVGSFVAAVAWVITKDLFGLYVTYGVMGSLYGALALVPLFLLWLWATWVIALFGLELTFTLQAMKGRRFKHETHKDAEDAVVDPAVMVVLATRLAAAFEKGRSVEMAELAQLANLPARLVRKMMGMLEDARIVHRVQNPMGQWYALARPAYRVGVDEVLAAAEHLLPTHVPGGEDAAAQQAWRFVGKLHDATHRIAQQRTLEDLLGEERARRAKARGTGARRPRSGTEAGDGERGKLPG